MAYSESDSLDWSHSWYEPGNWKLPAWWTDGPPLRNGIRATWREQVQFYNSWFVREVLDHTGGISILPKVLD